MIEKRTARVNRKKIKANDIRTIARIIENEYLSLLHKHENDVDNGTLSENVSKPAIHFKITTSDDTEYSSESIELLKDSGILDTKVIYRFSIGLCYYTRDIDITVDIADSQFRGYPGTIEVKGTDSIWVNGIFGKLLDAVNSWEIQDAIFKRFKWPISTIFGIITAFTIGWLITLPLQKPTAGPEMGEEAISVFIITALFTLPTVLFLFENYLQKLWPDIEIVPVPEHERKLDKNRRILYFVIIAIIVPFVVSIFANLVV